jgi:serine phosphatase RsbU (regulator of sigma subunit)
MIIPASTHVGRLSLESRHMPAAKGGGGDIHDAMATPFGIRLLIGDVMGTGEPAHQTGLSVLNAWRELAWTEPALVGIAERLHTLIARSDHPERFVTALLVTFPVSRDRAEEAGPIGGSQAELVCCGHPPPLLLRGASAAFLEPHPAPPLGLLDLTDGWCQASMFGVDAGDQWLLYTDGVSEARDAAGRFFPLADRAAQALPPFPAGQGSARPHLLDELVESLADHVGGRVTDDVLLLLASMSLATPQAGHSWGIVITSPRAAGLTGMKLCRGESTRRGGRTWRLHRCLSGQRGRT